MFRYIFTGKVLPERVDFLLTSHQTEATTNTGQKFKLVISIQKSQIFLEVYSENVIDDILTLRNGIVVLSDDLKKRYIELLSSIFDRKRLYKARTGIRRTDGNQRMEEITIMKMKCIELKSHL